MIIELMMDEFHLAESVFRVLNYSLRSHSCDHPNFYYF